MVAMKQPPNALDLNEDVGPSQDVPGLLSRGLANLKATDSWMETKGKSMEIWFGCEEG